MTFNTSLLQQILYIGCLLTLTSVIITKNLLACNLLAVLSTVHFRPESENNTAPNTEHSMPTPAVQLHKALQYLSAKLMQ